MPRRRPPGPPLWVLAVIVALTATSALAVVMAPSAHAQASGVQSADYDLGVKRFPEPGLTGTFARMPIRLWGTICSSAPSSGC